MLTGSKEYEWDGMADAIHLIVKTHACSASIRKSGSNSSVATNSYVALVPKDTLMTKAFHFFFGPIPT
jgi:hypothetical protein